MAKNLQGLVLLSVFLVACSTPARRLDDEASHLGFIRELWLGVDFTHVVYRNQAIGPLLHVYLDGDGLPWLRRTLVATDPTPRNPLLLELMVQDSSPTIYLGRPCYHGQSVSPACSPEWWTARRYGPEIVASMAAVLNDILDRNSYSGLVFIGYSGGGTLAMLLAEHFPSTQAIVTIAGNLDTDTWTEWHGYSPLRGSLNPASRPPLDAAIVQFHFAGGRDENIPVFLIQPVVLRQLCAKLIIIKTFDHVCCWQEEWGSILNRLRSYLQSNELGLPGSLVDRACVAAVL